MSGMASKAHGRAAFRVKASYTPSNGALKPTPPVSNKGVATRRALLSGMMMVASGLGVAQEVKADTFLKSRGIRNAFEEEEEALFQLRQEREGEALKNISDEVSLLERELDDELVLIERETAASKAGKFCATPFGVDVVGISEFVLLVGATVGGVTARQRKDEVELLNGQLRSINLSLRQQARSGTVYAPGLTYAPNSKTGIFDPASAAAAADLAVVDLSSVQLAEFIPKISSEMKAPTMRSMDAAPAMRSLDGSLWSMDEGDMNTEQLACRDALKTGKRMLKEKNGGAALVRFEKALILSKAFGDRIQQRRAVRGLAAAARLLGQYKQAIEYLERVLAISTSMEEFTGDADAYGTIADCYTDLGDFDKAAVMYDKYIERMNSDTPAKM